MSPQSKVAITLRFPTCATPQVEVSVHAACNRIVAETATVKERMVYLCLANLTFLGPGHSGMMQDLARVIADFLAASTNQAAAMVLMPNTAQVGSGANHTEDFVRSARRQVMEKLEDQMWKMESRECTFHFDELKMYSANRPLSHSGLFMISDECEKDKAHWKRSVVWTRRCIPGVMSVLPRNEFLNPLDEMEGVTNMKKLLSEAAEYRQHVTGVPFYQEVPQEKSKRRTYTLTN